MQIFSYFSEADIAQIRGSFTWDFTAVASKIFLRIFSGKPAWKVFTVYQKQKLFPNFHTSYVSGLVQLTLFSWYFALFPTEFNDIFFLRYKELIENVWLYLV
jgi:hypothetical protein